MAQRTGLVGWRGMVGSVLLERMQAEGDFDCIEPVFFSTSNAGGQAPAQAKNETRLQDAYDIEALKRCDIILTAQGGDYTKAVYPKLRAVGWNGPRWRPPRTHRRARPRAESSSRPGW